MIKTIVVAIDGSGFANRAVDAGADLAVACGARLILLTVLPETGLPPALREYVGTEGTYVAEALDQLLEQARGQASLRGATDIVCRQEEGNPPATILGVAVDTDADIIVLGRRGLGRIQELLLGSVSHRVAETAPCACMTVP